MLQIMMKRRNVNDTAGQNLEAIVLPSAWVSFTELQTEFWVRFWHFLKVISNDFQKANLVALRMNPVGTKNRQIHATYIGSTKAPNF